MACVFRSICAENCSNTIWSLLFCNVCVSWSKKISPAFNRVISYKLNPNDEVTTHESNKCIEKWFSFVFCVEFCFFETTISKIRKIDLRLFTFFLIPWASCAVILVILRFEIYNPDYSIIDIILPILVYASGLIIAKVLHENERRISLK